MDHFIPLWTVCWYILFQKSQTFLCSQNTSRKINLWMPRCRAWFEMRCQQYFQICQNHWLGKGHLRKWGNRSPRNLPVSWLSSRKMIPMVNISLCCPLTYFYLLVLLSFELDLFYTFKLMCSLFQILTFSYLHCVLLWRGAVFSFWSHSNL